MRSPDASAPSATRPPGASGDFAGIVRARPTNYRKAHPVNNWEKFVEVLIVGTFTVLITTALGLVYLHRSGIL